MATEAQVNEYLCKLKKALDNGTELPDAPPPDEDENEDADKDK